MWPQTDIGISICVIAALAIFGSFLFHPWTINRFWKKTDEPKPCVLIGKRKLNSKISRRILKHHRLIKGPSFYSIAVLDMIAFIFVFFNIYFNGFYSLRDVSFLITALIPTLIFVVYLYQGK